MGTRSTIKFYNEDDEPIVNIYQQYDGYINAVGYDLANFLIAVTMVNGLPLNPETKLFANGMGCLAAQYIERHKKGIGGLYLKELKDIQEYYYKVRYIDNKFQIKVYFDRDIIFTGDPEEFLLYIE